MSDLRRELIEALACGPDAPHCDTCNAVELVDWFLAKSAFIVADMDNADGWIELEPLEPAWPPHRLTRRERTAEFVHRLAART